MKLTIEQWSLVLLIIGREYNRANEKYVRLRKLKETDWGEDSVELSLARQEASALCEIYMSIKQQEI